MPGEISNVQVTRSKWPQNEPSVAVSWADPRVMLITGNDFSTTNPRTVLHRSTDGGSTFSARLLPRPDDLNATSDPVVDFAFPHRFLVGAVAFNRDGSAGRRRTRDGTIVAYRSDDDGRTFARPVIVRRSRGTDVFHDKPFLATDKSAVSPYDGYAYLSYTTFFRDAGGTEISIQRSADGGQTWAPPIALTARGVLAQGSSIAVGPRGQVYVSWIELDSAADGRFRFRRSDDGGARFGPTITVADISLLPFCRGGRAAECLPVPGWRFRTPTLSFLGADISRASDAGTVYAVWSEFRKERAAIWLCRSHSDGDSWSDPIRVSGGGQSILPNIAVEPSTGDLYVVYYGNELSPSPGTRLDVYVAEAAPGGRRFIQRRVSSRSFDPNADPFFGDPSDFIGDYISIAPLPDGGFVAVWTDTRMGNQDLFAGIADGVQ